LIIDTHCHVIVAEMTAGRVPEHWRPVVSRGNGRYRLVFRGREINSVVAEFTDVAVMLGQAAEAGVEIPSSVGGRYLGDDFFGPFWAAAEAAGALVFIHPATKGLNVPALDGYYLWNSVGNPLETAITAAHIAVSGVLERHPRLRILLAHGGGALPVVRGRLRRAFATRPEAGARAPGGPDESLRRFFYDTVTRDHDLLAGLIRYAGADHVLLGSDRPFDMGTADPVGEIRALGLADEDLVLSGNATRLLGGPR
jgi:aminocarboxymuconate-semialdehyde decarboxylase